MKFRAALIGCGKIGTEFADDPCIRGIYTHAGAYTACPRTELVAVCDTDKEKASRCGRRWNVQAVYTDLSALLEKETPDLISVCTPDETHAELLDTIIQHRTVKGILAEKPLALTTQDAHKVVERAEERGVLLAVNHTRRYSTGHAHVKRMIETGEIGQIQKVSGFYTKGILHNGTHWLDLARWLVGEIATVVGYTREQEPGTDPTIDVFLEFENGVTGCLQGCAAEAFSIFEIDIVGTCGRIRIVDAGHRVEVHRVSDSPYYSDYRALQCIREQDGEMENTLLHAVEDLVACVEYGGRPRCSGKDGLAALRIATAAVRSSRVRRPIELAWVGV